MVWIIGVCKNRVCTFTDEKEGFTSFYCILLNTILQCRIVYISSPYNLLITLKKNLIMQNSVKINGIKATQFNMNKLLKEYNLIDNEQYFEIIVESVINGQRTQAKEQFKAMPTEHRKTFVKLIHTEYDKLLYQNDKEIFIDLI